MTLRSERAALRRVYRRLVEAQGPSGWWPAQDPFEMAVGAVLVQAVSWTGAAQAVERLRARGRLSPGALASSRPEELEPLLRSARFARAKAQALVALGRWVEAGGHDLVALLSGPWPQVRARLLGLPRVGPETADAIGLYAGAHPVAMGDAHTERILRRLGLYRGPAGYGPVAEWLRPRLAGMAVPDLQEFHAQMDRLGHAICRSRPRCGHCPLRSDCPEGTSR